MATDDDWMKRANCRTLTIEESNRIFFPKKQGQMSEDRYSEARTFCDPCPVRITCGEYAVVYGLRSGMWGSLTPSQRRQLTKGDKMRIRRRWRIRHPSVKLGREVK